MVGIDHQTRHDTANIEFQHDNLGIIQYEDK